MVRLWLEQSSSSEDSVGCIEQLSLLLSARNVSLMAHSAQRSSAWAKLEALLGRLLAAGVVPTIAFEAQTMQLLRQQWPREILNPLASCLRGVLESWRRTSGKSDSEFYDLVEWVAWFFSSLEEDLDGSDF